jgi:phosphate starvation-inducible PhoH-like protein
MPNNKIQIDSDVENVAPKKRGRKSKKMNDKEIIHDFLVEQEQEYLDRMNDSEQEQEKQNKIVSGGYTKKNYENFAYLSAKERAAFEKKFTVPKNVHQEMYCKLLRTKGKKIVVANGPAGTGKTLFATEFGIRYFLTSTYEKLIFTRPSVSVDEELGFLPGTLEEKMAPWVRPIYDVLHNFLTPKEVLQLMEEKVIEIAPLGYMRGRTFKNAWIVADEMQNSTVSQMKMLLTRIGSGSKMVVTGDIQQHDRGFENNGLVDLLPRIGQATGIQHVEFSGDDVIRSEVIKEILNHVVKNSTLRKGLILLVEYCPKTIFDIFLKKGDQSKTKTK